MIEIFTSGSFDPIFERNALDLLMATILGGIIGLERQWRQRLAGLRTNTLVALGAATYVIFASQFADADPTRVAAQVVSGIGFLGAGVIFKEGLNVRGLNTAATLWCAAAVGLLAGTHHWALAVFASGLLVTANITLRPITYFINKLNIESAEVETSYAVTVICRSADEAKIRALLVQGFRESELHLQELQSAEIEGAPRVEIHGTLRSGKQQETALETIIGQLSMEDGVTSARWQSVHTFV